MNEIGKLAEQHILESASHLRHIDEMMARANQPHGKLKITPDTAAQLAEIQKTRDRLAQNLDNIRRQPAGSGIDPVKSAEEVKGLLAAVGLQLEQALGAMIK